MFKLAIKLLMGKKKKYAALLLSVAICSFFIMAIDTMYQGYTDTQIENAYEYGGRWDISIRTEDREAVEQAIEGLGLVYTGMNTCTYTAKLDEIPEDKKIGPAKDIATHYYLGLWAIPGGEDYSLKYRLMEGNWPESDNEIVLPRTFKYNGLSVREETIGVGDKITLEVGRRKSVLGTYVHKQINGQEEFISYETKEYTVCGIMEADLEIAGYYVYYGVTGLDESKADEEEYVVYYELEEKTCANLNNAYEALDGIDDLTEVHTNDQLYNALYLIENVDFLQSVKSGLYIFEAMLVVFAICIAGTNRYLSINEDSKQIALMDSIGAEKKQLNMLYQTANVIVILAGIIVSFILYLLFILIVQTSLMANIQNTFFKADYAPDILFCVIGLGIILISQMILTRIMVGNQIPKRVKNKKTERKTELEKKTKKQHELKGMFDLADRNVRMAGTKRMVQILMFTLIMIVVPICIVIGASAYKKSLGINRQLAADFYMTKGDLQGHIYEELVSNQYVDNAAKMFGGVRGLIIPLKYIRTDVAEKLRVLANGSYMNERDEFESIAGVTFINEDCYKRLESLNPGKLPKYEEFINGDNGLLFAAYRFRGSKDIISVGGMICEHMKEAELIAFTEAEETFTLNILASIDFAIVDVIEGDMQVVLYIPEHVYEKYGKNMVINTMYCIDGKRGCTEALAEYLSELAYREDFLLQDNISEVNAAKDALLIQCLSIFSCMLVLVFMSLVAMNIMGKIDLILRKKSYDSYRVLGLSIEKAFLLQLLEQIIPAVDAFICSLVMHFVLRYTVLQGIYEYYEMELSHVAVAFIGTVLCVFLIVVVNVIGVTRKRYKHKLV